mmetsp:Transcript_62322/g.190448  ORF Transcript_62322/g.190448 Transcript_62322/m.190448 type:complete len:441 (+) Transcript_62322:3253-4575(+)
MNPVLAERIGLRVAARSNGHLVLHLRHRLTCQRRLVHDGTALQDQAIARNREVLVLVRRALVLGAFLGLVWPLRHQRHDVAGQQVLDGFLHPLKLPVNVHVETFGTHAAQRRHGLQALESSRSLEAKDSHQRECSVLPVGVQHPQRRAKELENRQRSGQLLLVQLHESWPGQIEHVCAKLVLGLLYQAFLLKAAGSGVLAPFQVDRATDQADAICVGIARQLRVVLPGLYDLVHLVLEGKVVLQGDLGLLHLANGGLALVRLRRQPHEGPSAYSLCGLEQACSLEADRPMTHQVEEDVRADRQEDQSASPSPREQFRGQRFLIDLELRLLGLLAALEGDAFVLGRQGLLLERSLLLLQRPRVGLASGFVPEFQRHAVQRDDHRADHIPLPRRPLQDADVRQRRGAAQLHRGQAPGRRRRAASTPSPRCAGASANRAKIAT